MPLLVGVVVGMVYSAIDVDPQSTPILILNNLILSASIWFGVMYSASYLAKKYVVSNAAKVVNLSTIYEFVIAALFVWLGFSASSGNTEAVMFVVVFQY